MKIRCDQHGGPSYVDISFWMRVGGKLVGKHRLHYSRGRGTCATTLDDLASILLIYDRLMFGSVRCDDVLREAAKILPSRNGLTVNELIRKNFVELEKTVEEEFNERNAAGYEHSFWGKEKDDYLKFQLNERLHSFDLAPLPIKYGILYGIFRGWFHGEGFGGLRKDIENCPQYIKDIVDGMMTNNKEKKE